MFPLKRPLLACSRPLPSRKLSEYVREQETSPGQSTKIANLLVKVEDMSPEEIINAVVDMREGEQCLMTAHRRTIVLIFKLRNVNYWKDFSEKKASSFTKSCYNLSKTKF